ncbi:MAG TPA: hypothetical protein DEG17_19845 [Cyanobacteria bacterium UBA11149]|nr:hypothetical protein [Cyanobacteria bacterium UBA11366]HBK66660.1 hypothetical protein [Cyanobacteria bacterium UBA11166]HBR75915.1 hypothetical protein [Cyanobacteria bacterium UBA11159]HBS68065.1 hypothetical protein [Cyanobacteria bacterium UBA11153]HBW91052.1 hypothetical protein [Cyanobacteria bacterium UBA11149]HCA95764.1 hypothetical protein [Cyanobacteria bacterium UBA9226]
MYLTQVKSAIKLKISQECQDKEDILYRIKNSRYNYNNSILAENMIGYSKMFTNPMVAKEKALATYMGESSLHDNPP